MKFAVILLGAIAFGALAQTTVLRERRQLQQDRQNEVKDLKARDAQAVHSDNVERRGDRHQLHQDAHQRRKGRR